MPQQTEIEFPTTIEQEVVVDNQGAPPEDDTTEKVGTILDGCLM